MLPEPGAVIETVIDAEKTAGNINIPVSVIDENRRV
jgi:hypothetical protein